MSDAFRCSFIGKAFRNGLPRKTRGRFVCFWNHNKTGKKLQAFVVIFRRGRRREATRPSPNAPSRIVAAPDWALRFFCGFFRRKLKGRFVTIVFNIYVAPKSAAIKDFFTFPVKNFDYWQATRRIRRIA